MTPEEVEQTIDTARLKLNRRTRAYLKLRSIKTRILFALLGSEAFEAPDWSTGFTFANGWNSWTTIPGDGQRKALVVGHCPICAAYVRIENWPFHERWHIAGSVKP